jgi:probable HAF family extracellular repeat protein
MAQSKHTGRTFASDAIRHLTAVLALAVANVCVRPAHARDAVTVTAITPLPGSGAWGPGCVSGNGLWLTGGCNLGSGSLACTWNHEGTATQIDLPPIPKYPYSTGTSINYDGTVVVGVAFPPGYNGSASRAFRWTADSGMTDLGSVNGYRNNFANATSFDGSVVVGFSGEHGFRWTAELGMVDLGLPADAASRSATIVSGDGATVGGHTVRSGLITAFAWTAANGVQELATLGNCREGYPSAINADGSVIVGANYEWNSGRRVHAVRWTTGGVQDLGSLGTGWYSTATHVSANGQVVLGVSGPSNDTSTYPTPWIWTPTTGMQGLANYLVSQGANLSEIPQPMYVYGMSSAGSEIGLATVYGRGYVLVSSVPVPLDTDGDGVLDEQDNCPAIANPTQADCDSNSVGNVCEIAAGAPDFNGDTIPDTCQCLADLFVDRQVNGADLGALLAFWGPVNPALPSADINRDGNVNGADLGYLLNAWGACTN